MDFITFITVLSLKKFKYEFKKGMCPGCLSSDERKEGTQMCPSCMETILGMVSGFENIDSVIEKITETSGWMEAFLNDDPPVRPGPTAETTSYLKLLLLVKERFWKMKGQKTPVQAQLIELVSAMCGSFPGKKQYLSLFLKGEVLDALFDHFLSVTSFSFEKEVFEQVHRTIMSGTTRLEPKESVWYQHFHLMVMLMGAVDLCPPIDWGRFSFSDLIMVDLKNQGMCSRFTLELIRTNYGLSRRKFMAGEFLNYLFSDTQLQIAPEMNVTKLLSEKRSNFMLKSDTSLSGRKLFSFESGECGSCHADTPVLLRNTCLDCIKNSIEKGDNVPL